MAEGTPKPTRSTAHKAVEAAKKHLAELDKAAVEASKGLKRFAPRYHAARKGRKS